MKSSRSLRSWSVAIVLLALSGCATPYVLDSTPPSGGGRASKTVEILPGQGAVDHVVKLSRGHEEAVRWHNRDARGHTLHFTDWPFREPHQEILVDAGRSSATFHVYRNQDTGTYTYSIKPAVGAAASTTQVRGEGPPDPPAVEVGD